MMSCALYTLIRYKLIQYVSVKIRRSVWKKDFFMYWCGSSALFLLCYETNICKVSAWNLHFSASYISALCACRSKYFEVQCLFSQSLRAFLRMHAKETKLHDQFPHFDYSCLYGCLRKKAKITIIKRTYPAAPQVKKLFISCYTIIVYLNAY